MGEPDESSDWNFDEKLDKENYKNCEKLSKGESIEKLRHSRNCNERAGKEAIKCTECGKKFTNLKNLKRHKKTFHKKIKTDETENLEDNCEKCEILSKGESAENLRHTPNCEKRD